MSNTIGAYVELYTRLGFSVWPGKRGSKQYWGSPVQAQSEGDLRDGVLQRFRGKQEGNIIAKLGESPGIVILDVDVKNGAPGEASFSELLALAGLAEEELGTACSETPSGGRHYFFRTPAGISLPLRSPIPGFPGLDLLSGSGSVVLPPSSIEGRSYSWRPQDGGAPLSPTDITEMPEQLIEQLVSACESPVRAVERDPLDRPSRLDSPLIRECMDERVIPLEAVADALEAIPAHGFTRWRRIAMCLAGHYGDAAWSVLDQWSRGEPDRYDEKENRRLWETYLRDSDGLTSPYDILETARLNHGWCGSDLDSVVPEWIEREVEHSDRAEAVSAELGRALASIAGDSESKAVFYAPMGAGKTRALASLAASRCAGMTFAAPNHDLVREFAEQLEENGVPFIHAKGVGEACHFKDAFEAQGRPAEWKQVACGGCPHREGCSVHAVQDATHEELDQAVLLTTHVGLLSLPDREQERPVIVDERPPTTSSACVSCDALGSYLVNAEIKPRARAVLRRVRGFVEDNVMDRLRDLEWGSHGPDAFVVSNEIRAASIEIDEAQFGLVTDLEAALAMLPPPMADPEAVRSGHEAVHSTEPVRHLIRCLLGVLRQEEGVAIGLRNKAKILSLELMWRTQSPKRCLVMDGTLAFTEREIIAWFNEVPARFGVQIHAMPGLKVKRVWYRGPFFNRRRSWNPTDRERQARFIGDVVLPYKDVMGGEPCAILLPKILHDELSRTGAFTADEVGYFGRDEAGTNRFCHMRILATVSDFHEAIHVSLQRSICLGLNDKQHIRDRRCTAMLQAGARVRWNDLDGECIDIHMGAYPRPGWSLQDVEVRDQPNLTRDKQDLIAQVRGIALACCRHVLAVDVPLLMDCLRGASGSLSERRLRRLLNELAEEPGLSMSSLPNPYGSGRPRKVLHGGGVAREHAQAGVELLRCAVESVDEHAWFWRQLIERQGPLLRLLQGLGGAPLFRVA